MVFIIPEAVFRKPQDLTWDVGGRVRLKGGMPQVQSTGILVLQILLAFRTTSFLLREKVVILVGSLRPLIWKILCA
jgi:hypothetical protein